MKLAGIPAQYWKQGIPKLQNEDKTLYEGISLVMEEKNGQFKKKLKQQDLKCFCSEDKAVSILWFKDRLGRLFYIIVVIFKMMIVSLKTQFCANLNCGKNLYFHDLRVLIPTHFDCTDHK